MIQDTVDLALFFSLRPQYAAIGDCCYPVDASCQLADVPAVNELPESELFFSRIGSIFWNDD